MSVKMYKGHWAVWVNGKPFMTCANFDSAWRLIYVLSA